MYDAQDLQKKIAEQCLQMEPVVRPLLTVLEKYDKVFVAAEIPGMDVCSRPCYYKGKGRLRGSYVRVDDHDELMTEYEVYSYEAFRRNHEDDIRPVERAKTSSFNEEKLGEYLRLLKSGKPNLSMMDDDTVLELMSMKQGDTATLAGALLFSVYPQAYFPQLAITAVRVPGKKIGDTGSAGERFIDNMRIEGTIPEMLSEAVNFVRRNMKTKTIINPLTGIREDRTEYPVIAVREAVLNALVHRDYSTHTEAMPIRIEIYDDRIEIHNPGGLYGRMTVDKLGKIQPDTRNPVLATTLETLRITENRYSGIPSILGEMRKYDLDEPVFLSERGEFTVVLYNEKKEHFTAKEENLIYNRGSLEKFCEVPRTRDEIAEFLGLSSKTYVIQTYVKPLIEKGIIGLAIPDKPQSSKQKYFLI